MFVKYMFCSVILSPLFRKSLMSQYEAKITDALKMMKNLQTVRNMGKSRVSMGSRLKLGSRMNLQKSMRDLKKSMLDLGGRSENGRQFEQVVLPNTQYQLFQTA